VLGKAKKHVLTFEQTYDFQMIGVCSHHNDYRLAWSLNQELGISLTKSEEDYVVTNRKGTKISQHSLYEFRDYENLIEYHLIKNKSMGKFLVPEKPVVDYFLFLVENHLFEPEELVDRLRSVPSVLGSFLFDPEDFESTGLLVFN
jgi:hypothetical protein